MNGVSGVPYMNNSQQLLKQIVQYKVQQKKSARPSSNYRTQLVTYDHTRARSEVISCQVRNPKLPVRLIVETYMPEWKLAKREVRKDKRFESPV